MAGRPKGTPKTGGRKPGSRNKSTLGGERAVERIREKLRRDKKLTFEDISIALLTCGVPAVIQRELHSLREFVYTKPKQTMEISTEDGKPIPVAFTWDISAGSNASGD